MNTKKLINEFKLTIDSKSVNEAFARVAVSAFVTPLDPTLEEIADLKTAVSEAVTNCIVHAYKDTYGKIFISGKLFDDNTVKIVIRDKGCGIYFDDYVYIVKNGLFASATMYFDKAHFEVVKSIDDVPKDGWMKVIFWSNPITIKSLQKFIDKNENPDANFMSSSVCTIEMLQKGTHKGVGIMKLADMLGIDKSHVAAIGDYYNDWDMLKTVGLPACAGQAPAPIHNICKFEACHCNKGCVADLLEYIMSGKAEENIKKENNKK